MHTTDVGRESNGPSQPIARRAGRSTQPVSDAPRRRWKLITWRTEERASAPQTVVEHVLRQMPAPVLVVRGRMLVIEAANDAARALVGDGPAVGRTLGEALPGLAERRCLANVYEALAGGGNEGKCAVFEFEQHASTTAAAGGVWRVSCKRLGEADSEDLMVLMFTDIAAETERYAVLEQRAAKAYAANHERDRLLAMLVHELRGPLAPMTRSLERIHELGMSTREHAVIERQVHHLQRLIEDLLDVASVARGGVELRKRHVEVREFVTSAVERVAPLIEERKQSLIVEVPAGLAVNADPDRMSQVVCNLLGNAAKFSPERAEIAINARLVSERVRLTVADRGIGLAAENIEAIIAGSNGHGHVSRGDHGASLGLGLMIVRDLVARHGGEVLARSKGRGCGSEFIVDLPAAAP